MDLCANSQLFIFVWFITLIRHLIKIIWTGNAIIRALPVHTNVSRSTQILPPFIRSILHTLHDLKCHIPQTSRVGDPAGAFTPSLWNNIDLYFPLCTVLLASTSYPCVATLTTYLLLPCRTPQTLIMRSFFQSITPPPSPCSSIRIRPSQVSPFPAPHFWFIKWKYHGHCTVRLLSSINSNCGSSQRV